MQFEKIMYHTQEKWRNRLTSPVLSTREDAWFGNGYYFWYDELDAIDWGRTSKRRNGMFEIYKSEIRSDNILDTVFNEKTYLFWIKQVDKVAGNFIKKSGEKPTIKEINDYFKEKATWKDVDGILFQEIPINENKTLVEKFYYKKRIQLAVYNKHIILSFLFHDEGKC